MEKFCRLEGRVGSKTISRRSSPFGMIKASCFSGSRSERRPMPRSDAMIRGSNGGPLQPSAFAWATSSRARSRMMATGSSRRPWPSTSLITDGWRQIFLPIRSTAGLLGLLTPLGPLDRFVDEFPVLRATRLQLGERAGDFFLDRLSFPLLLVQELLEAARQRLRDRGLTRSHPRLVEELGDGRPERGRDP